MGCDIHMAVERRENGRWVRVMPPVEARDPWLVEWAAKQPADNWSHKRAEVTWYSDRNYDCFAVLADVRNNGHITPIATPRGFPDDLSDGVRALLDENRPDDCDDVWMGDHSHTWLLLSEVLAYDWDKGTLNDGVVPFHEFRARIEKYGTDVPLDFRDGWAPYSGYSGSTLGRGIYTMEALVALAKMARGGVLESDTERPYVRDYWTTPLRAQVGSFLTRVVPALQGLASDPADVRLVFGFDS